MLHSRLQRPVTLSIGIMACDGEHSIKPMLESLLRQSAFECLGARHRPCEVLVVARACTDHTAIVARQTLARMERERVWNDAVVARVIELAEPGRNNAWNRFVHEFSAVEARYLVSLDAEVMLHHRDAIFSLVTALQRRAHVNGASGRRYEDVLFKERRTFWERLALAAAPVRSTGGARLNGEFFCLRAPVARRLYLPPGLEEGADTFVTQMVGTHFLSARFDPTRIAMPPDAAHICAAHTAPGEVVDNEERRLIGQTAAHVLLRYLQSRSRRERAGLVEMLRGHEACNREWLTHLVAAHVRRRRFFGPLFPGALRLQRARLVGVEFVRRFPETIAGFVLTMIANLRARRYLRARGTAATAHNMEPVSVPPGEGI